jgi:iron-sulfur cluster repair protein YtfE (RIC family)
LRGDAEHEAWLRNVLTRHMRIEEQVLFPAYLDAGGNAGWVRGLCNEHRQLELHLDRLSEAESRRRFLLLLDGHDEKEEQIVYPDILAKLGDDAQGLGRQAMLLSVA